MGGGIVTAFGTLLRQYRVRVGISQNECSRRAGVDQAYGHLLEAGKRSAPSRDIVLRLAAVLALDDVSTDRLLIASGHCPEIVRRMTDAQLDALYLLAGPGISEPARLRVVQ